VPRSAAAERAVLGQVLVALAQIDRALAGSTEADGLVALHRFQLLPASAASLRQRAPVDVPRRLGHATALISLVPSPRSGRSAPPISVSNAHARDHIAYGLIGKARRHNNRAYFEWIALVATHIIISQLRKKRSLVNSFARNASIPLRLLASQVAKFQSYRTLLATLKTIIAHHSLAQAAALDSEASHAACHR